LYVASYDAIDLSMGTINACVVCVYCRQKTCKER
jgi:hypothetical protein